MRNTTSAVAYGSIRRIYSKLTQRGLNATLTYCELFPVVHSNTGLATFIPINPAKWIGTRTYQQARLFSEFRPQTLHVEYSPNVSTGTSGTVSFGSYYGVSHPPVGPDLYMRMVQSEGGFISTLWQPARSTVRCGTALAANKFHLNKVTEEDIPVTLFAITTSTDLPTGTVVGYLSVYGTMLLTGTRADGDDENLSGTYPYDVTVRNGSVVFTTRDTPSVFKVGDELAMTITDVGDGVTDLLLADGNALDFRSYFKTFLTVLGKVVEVVGTVARIAVAIAPIVLADEYRYGTFATHTIVTASLIGKRDVGSVDIEDSEERVTVLIQLPSNLVLSEIEDERLLFLDVMNHKLGFTVIRPDEGGQAIQVNSDVDGRGASLYIENIDTHNMNRLDLVQGTYTTPPTRIRAVKLMPVYYTAMEQPAPPRAARLM